MTTGSDSIDYFLTCSAMEPADAPLHYVERLIGLPGIGVNYSMPSAVPEATRERFGLPSARRLYLCLQSLFKVHPEMDDLFADVLEADPDGILVFFQGASPKVTERLAARLHKALSSRRLSAKGQVKFLPRVDGVTFRQVAKLADVVLDTLHWSGGNTSLDALSVATPVVTIPGRLMRGRQTTAMLQLLGLDDLIVRDYKSYGSRAAEIARDRDLNHALRKCIQERRAELFDKADTVAALADSIFGAAIDRSRPVERGE